MKRTFYNLSRMIIAVCLIIISLIVFCACKEETDPCENEVCIECSDKATHYVSGAKPVNGKASTYRIFYCDGCWDKIPKAELKP